MSSRSVQRVARPVVACALGLPPIVAAQTAIDVQTLKIELSALRQKQTALEKELETIKAQRTSAAIVVQLDRAPVRGSAAARVVIVEVSDFECEFCSRYARETAPQIVKDYVAPGRVAYAYMHLPLQKHLLAPKASEASICAGDQGKFWDMRERLFGVPMTIGREDLRTHATALGLSLAPFTTCMEKSVHAAEVQSDIAAVKAAGVSSVPSFLIGAYDAKAHTVRVARTVVGAKAFNIFQEAIDAVLTTAPPQRK